MPLSLWLQHLPVLGIELGGEVWRRMSICVAVHENLRVSFRMSAEDRKRHNIDCTKLGRAISLLLMPPTLVKSNGFDLS